jgi:hypothetical protein
MRIHKSFVGWMCDDGISCVRCIAELAVPTIIDSYYSYHSYREEWRRRDAIITSIDHTLNDMLNAAYRNGIRDQKNKETK